MERRPLAEISKDLKCATGRLISAEKKFIEAEKELLVATLEILNLEKELERGALY